MATIRDTAFRPLRAPRNLTAELVNRLTEEITAGNLAPNARLPTEHEMMASFGVSRTVVREALAVLRAEGLVKSRQGSGVYVASDLRRQPFRIDPEGLQSVAEVVQVLELRMAVETEAAGLAAERREEDDLAAIEDTTHAFNQAMDRGEAAVDADFEFHAAIGRATHNPFFSSFLGFLGRRLVIPRRTISLEGETPQQRRAYLLKVIGEHEAIQRAIAAGDAAAARRAMRKHLSRSCRRYMRLAPSLNAGNPIAPG